MDIVVTRYREENGFTGGNYSIKQISKEGVALGHQQVRDIKGTERLRRKRGEEQEG